MDNVKIQCAELSDIDKIATDTGIDSAIINRWIAMIKGGELVLIVAIKNGRYVGRVNLWLASADEPAIRKYFNQIPLINALQINRSEQSKGIGSKIMQFAHEQLRTLGYKNVGLGVEPDNIKAISLYKKLGYDKQQIGTSDVYITEWDETEADGTMQKYSVEANFYLKNL